MTSFQDWHLACSVGSDEERVARNRPTPKFPSASTSARTAESPAASTAFSERLAVLPGAFQILLAGRACGAFTQAHSNALCDISCC